MSIRIVDMPDLGAVTDDSSVVGEHAGSGRFAITAMRDYITTTGGGPFLPLAGGNLAGNLTTSATANITAGNDVFVTDTLHVNPIGTWEWSFSVDPATGSKIQTYRTGWSDRWDAATGRRAWNGPIATVPTELMGLSGAGDLVTRTSVTSPSIHSTGDLDADGDLNVSGTFTGNTISTTGDISSNSSIGTAGNLYATGNLNAAHVYAASTVHVGGSDYTLSIDGSGNRSMNFSSTWRLTWTQTDGNLIFYRSDGVAMFTSVGYAGDFAITGNNAFKPGGGSWAAPSDSRIKTVTGDYTRGLAEILALAPKRFTYRGNDTPGAPDAATAAPYKTSPHYMAATSNSEFVGLVAQDLEAVMPEMVTKSGGYIDGAAASDIMTVDRSALDLALVNAIKELEARIAALESVGAAAQRGPAAD